MMSANSNIILTNIQIFENIFQPIPIHTVGNMPLTKNMFVKKPLSL